MHEFICNTEENVEEQIQHVERFLYTESHLQLYFSLNLQRLKFSEANFTAKKSWPVDIYSRFHI